VSTSTPALGIALAAGAVSTAPLGAASVAGAALASGGGAAAGTLIQFLNMTKLKFAVASIIALAGVITPWTMQRQSLGHLRQENQNLKQRVSELGELERENERLSNLVVKASTDSRNPAEMNELLRLRGEVARLRNAEKELAKLRQETTKLASANKPPPADKPERELFFFVGGEVSVPARFPWTNGMTLAAAIELAQGYTENANRSIAQIKDAAGSSVTINQAESSDSKASAQLIQPGVTVFVPRKNPEQLGQ
jgi:SLBB domain